MGQAETGGLEVTPKDLITLRTENPDLVVLDCREPEEVRIAAFPGAVHIPMQQIPARTHELDSQSEIVVVCHHGVRSLHVTRWLKTQAGFENVRSLRGGIDAWSIAMDPSVPRY